MMKRIYRPIQQLPYCCVPTILQWILYRRGFDILEQEFIGAELGLRIPKRLSKYFRNNDIHFIANDAEEFGTQTLKKEKYSINNFFKRNNIPLKLSELHFFKNVKLLEDFLVERLKGDDDIILSYHTRILGKERAVGHFSLIVDFDSKNGDIIIGDSYPPFFKTISVRKMLFSISDKADGMQRGLYVVSGRKECFLSPLCHPC